MSNTVTTHSHFLAKDPLYDTEKPYSLRFTAPEGLARANIKLEKHTIRVRDIRAAKKPPTLRADGFELLTDFETVMKYEDFDNEATVKEVYLREVANCLKTLFGAQHVQIFEHTVRKRHQTFPISTGEPYQYNQPTSIAHVDTTVPWALAMAAQLNPSRNREFLHHRLQCVNFWRPICGPVSDWPLALCSSRTLDPLTQTEPCDLVYPDYVVENRQVYYSEDYDWFYASAQTPREAWVFVQSDSEERVGPVAHTAFPLHDGEDHDPSTVPPRESIEVRALVYYGGFDDAPENDVGRSVNLVSAG